MEVTSSALARTIGLRLLIAGGGTGGHIYPGLAVAEEWRNGGGDVAFAGVPGNLEGRLTPEAGYPFYPVEVHGLTRGRSLQDRVRLLRAMRLLLTLAPLRQALGVVKEFRPNVVLGTGGYVSGPALLAARLAGLPTMMLQLDATPGIANRIIARFADCIGVALPGVESQFKRRDRVRLVGNPVRRDVLSASRAEGLALFGLDSQRRTLLVFGGSLGSRAINEALVGALRLLQEHNDLQGGSVVSACEGRSQGTTNWTEGWQVIHITGKTHPLALPREEAEAMGLVYRTMEYCDRMPLALAASDLAVCRSGATSVAELCARGVAAILIPWSSAAGNHQEANAAALVRGHAAEIILDRELSATRLARALQELFSNTEHLERMAAASRALGKPDAAARVVAELMRLASP